MTRFRLTDMMIPAPPEDIASAELPATPTRWDEWNVRASVAWKIQEALDEPTVKRESILRWAALLDQPQNQPWVSRRYRGVLEKTLGKSDLFISQTQ
jgi:hypothetical protein